MKRKTPLTAFDSSSSSDGDYKISRKAINKGTSQQKPSIRSASKVRGSKKHQRQGKVKRAPSSARKPEKAASPTVAMVPSASKRQPTVTKASAAESSSDLPPIRSSLNEQQLQDDTTTSTRLLHTTTTTTEITSNVQRRLPVENYMVDCSPGTFCSNSRSDDRANPAIETSGLLIAKSSKRKRQTKLPKAPRKRTAYGEASAKVMFSVDETNQCFALVEGVETSASTDTRDGYLMNVLLERYPIPRCGRMIELPCQAHLGQWKAEIVPERPSSIRQSLLSHNVKGFRLTIRHESCNIPLLNRNRSREKDSLSNMLPSHEEDLTVSVIHPAHNRVSSMEMQGILDPHTHPHSFLGLLAILAFDGFTSTSEMNARAKEVSQILERVLVHPDSQTSKSLHPNQLLLEIPGGTRRSVANSDGISMLCCLPLDSKYYLLIGQDSKLPESPLVAIDCKSHRSDIRCLQLFLTIIFLFQYNIHVFCSCFRFIFSL